ncbi:MAG: hypothetical protein LBG58_09385 [Planctomycetaceae bacterium]|jgi:hypothetical protein|nr:hypothetical protein [Planctomycetaceae bacterium]
MKLFIIYFIFLQFLFLNLAGCTGQSKLDNQIKIIPQNNEHKPLLYSELSSVLENETLFTGNFILSNKSLNDVKIELKDIGCGCLSLQKERQPFCIGDSFVIPSGKSVSISMTMKMPLRSGQNEYSAILTVEYQKIQSVLEISMKCPIIENISVTPKIVQVEFDKNNVVNRSFSVILAHASHDQSVLKSPPNISKLPNYVSLKNISVHTDMKEVVSGIWQKEWCLNFNVNKPDEMKKQEAPILIGFSFPNDPTAVSEEFSLILTKTYGIDYPARVDFPDTVVNEKKSRVFSIQSASSLAFTIKSISCNNLYFTILQNSKSDKSEQHWIEAIFEPKTTGENHSKLIIETTHPDAKHLEIELVGIGYANN